MHVHDVPLLFVVLPIYHYTSVCLVLIIIIIINLSVPFCVCVCVCVCLCVCVSFQKLYPLYNHPSVQPVCNQ